MPFFSTSSSSSSEPEPAYYGPPVFRRATIRLPYMDEADWIAADPIPKAGQICINTDGRFKIGDGVSFWSALAYHTHAMDEIPGLTTALTDKLDAALYTRGFTVSVSGRTAASEVLATIPIIDGINQFILATGGAGISAEAGVAATASTTITIKKNGADVATIVWSAAGTTGAPIVASTVSFEAGDILTIHGPVSPDATLADIGITIGGARA